MVRVGNIEVGVNADVRDLRRGLGLARTEVDSFSSGIGGIATRITGFTSALTSVSTSFSAFADGARIAVGALRELTELSDRFAERSSTALSLNVDLETFNELSRAARVITGEADAARDSLRDLQQAFSEVAVGDARALEGFRNLGLESSVLSRSLTDIDGALFDVLQRVRELNPVLARSELSKLVGEDGSFRILQLANNFETLQRVVAQPSFTASREAVVALQRFALQVHSVTESLESLSIQVLGESGVLGAIEGLVRSLTRGGSIEEFAIRTSLAFNRLSQAALRTALILNRIPGPTLGRFDTGELREQLEILRDVRTVLRDRLGRVGEEPEPQQETAGTQTVLLAQEAASILEAAGPVVIAELESGISSIFDNITVVETVEDFQRQAELYNEGVRGTAGRYRELARQLDELNARFEAGTVSAEDITRAISIQNEALGVNYDALVLNREGLVQLSETLSSVTAQTGNAWRSLIDGAASQFSLFLSNAISGIDDLDDAFDAFIRSVAGALISQGTSDLVTALFPGRQTGGPVFGGQLYETHGLGNREFFIPNANGRIQVGGAPGSSVTINLTVGDVATGRQVRDEVEVGVRRALQLAAESIDTPGSSLNTSVAGLAGRVT